MTDKPQKPGFSETEKRPKKSRIATNAEKRKDSGRFKFMTLGILFVLVVIYDSVLLSENVLRDKKLEQQDSIQAQQISLLLADQKQMQQKLLFSQQQMISLKQKQDDIQQSYNHLINGNSQFYLRSSLVQVTELLQLAQLKLKFNLDASTTIFLLQKADQILASLQNPSFLPVRQTIANDILQLKNANQIDRISLLARLNALNEKTLELPLSLMSFHQSAQQISKEQPSKRHWKELIKASFSSLKDLIIIRHYETPYVPLLPPAQQQALLQTLSQLMNQAGWAVMQNNVHLYHWSLNSAAQLLIKYFPASSPDVINMLTELHALQQSYPNIPYPDLQELMTQFEQQKNKIIAGSSI